MSKKSYLQKINKIITDEFSATKKTLTPKKLSEMLKLTQTGTKDQLKELYDNFIYQSKIKSKIEPVKKSTKGRGRPNKQTKLHIEQLNKINVYPNEKTIKYKNIKFSTKIPKSGVEIKAENKKLK